jgi:hypothetical protein
MGCGHSAFSLLRRCSGIAFSWLWVFLAFTQIAAAQVDEGSTTGTVTDTTGTVVPSISSVTLSLSPEMGLRNTITQ